MYWRCQFFLLFSPLVKKKAQHKIIGALNEKLIAFFQKNLAFSPQLCLLSSTISDYTFPLYPNHFTNFVFHTLPFYWFLVGLSIRNPGNGFTFYYIGIPMFFLPHHKAPLLHLSAFFKSSTKEINAPMYCGLQKAILAVKKNWLICLWFVFFFLRQSPH